MAKKVHPDKCTTTASTEEFQALSQAYQVLINPRLRAAYDSAGEAGVQQATMLDPAALFELLFEPGASKAWVLLIGQLQAITLVEHAHSTLSRAGLASLLAWTQRKREIDCAVHLAGILDHFHGDPGKFSEYLRGDVLPLLDTNSRLAGSLMGVLGVIYIEQANQVLATNFCSASLASLQESTNGYKSQFVAISAAAKVAATVLRGADNDVLDTELLLGAAYAASIAEIESSTRASCWMVLHDHGLGEAELRKRALALEHLGVLLSARSRGMADALEEMAARLGMFRPSQ